MAVMKAGLPDFMRMILFLGILFHYGVSNPTRKIDLGASKLELGGKNFTRRKLDGSGGNFKLMNECGYTVWVGTQSNAGQAVLESASVKLEQNEMVSVTTPANWGGRFWGRTGCNFDPSTNRGTCETGDCGGQLQCQGAGGKPPATLAEFTLSGADGRDYYDVSLVDGYNIPISVAPSNSATSSSSSESSLAVSYSCGWAGCSSDLNDYCPSQLQVQSQGQVVACRSACDAFGGSQYCCTGANGNPQTCPPTDYSKTFKKACPRAYSYAYDDASSTFTCVGGAYTITFCPTSQGGYEEPRGANASGLSADGDPSTSASHSAKAQSAYHTYYLSSSPSRYSFMLPCLVGICTFIFQLDSNKIWW